LPGVGSTTITIAASVSAIILSVCVLTVILRLRRRPSQQNAEAPEIKMERAPSNTSIAALESRFFPSMKINGLLPYIFSASKLLLNRNAILS
jgi:hypothetical protein